MKFKKIFNFIEIENQQMKIQEIKNDHDKKVDSLILSKVLE